MPDSNLGIWIFLKIAFPPISAESNVLPRKTYQISILISKFNPYSDPERVIYKLKPNNHSELIKIN